MLNRVITDSSGYRKIAEDWYLHNRFIPQSPKNVLLTAFENTSSELFVKAFDEKYRKLILKNDKVKSILQFENELKSHEYDYVFSFGQKPVIIDKIYIEKYGKAEVETYKASIDLAELAKVMTESGLAVRLSENAGTSFCNNIYAYGLNYIFSNDKKTKMVFIHIPFLKNISEQQKFFDHIKEALNYFICKDI